MFDEEGRFLGGAAIPDGVQTFPRPFMHGDTLLGVFMDDLGTLMVKRYRIVLPAG